jgi:hypothetical protein
MSLLESTGLLCKLSYLQREKGFAWHVNNQKTYISGGATRYAGYSPAYPVCPASNQYNLHIIHVFRLELRSKHAAARRDRDARVLVAGRCHPDADARRDRDALVLVAGRRRPDADARCDRDALVLVAGALWPLCPAALQSITRLLFNLLLFVFVYKNDCLLFVATSS